VNWIDTAAVYGLGHSEEIVARALKSWSGPRPYVFTKCGLRWDANGQVQKVLSADSIRGEVEDSLRRLAVDVIDLYQIHWPPDPDSPQLEEGWCTLANLQREGKVRWIGVSNFNVDQLGRAQAIAPVTSLQPRYSLVHREVEDEILPYCLREGIGVIVYSPMASGLLTGAMTRDRAANLPTTIGARTIPTLPSRTFLATWRWLSACGSLPGATTDLLAKWQSPGRCTIPRSPEPSSGLVTRVRRRESCAPATCTSAMRR